VSFTTTTKDGKGKDENNDLNAATNGGGDDHVPLGEQHCALTTQVGLGKEAPEEVGEEGGVDSDGEPARPSRNDGRVDLVEAQLGEVLVRQPEWNRGDEPDCQADGHHDVGTAGAEDLVADTTPGNGLSVVGLHVLAGPNVGSLNTEEDFTLVLDD